jgi:hypothetical protein
LYGTKWLKALYRGYTDSSFSEYTAQPAFQGTQGPTIRAETGDLIEILFINKLKKNHATIHSMGLAYSKLNEGSNYPNNTRMDAAVNLPLSDRVPPAVGPGDCVVYKWVVSEPAGPPNGTPAKVREWSSLVSITKQDTDPLLPFIRFPTGRRERWLNRPNIHLRTRRNELDNGVVPRVSYSLQYL